MVTRFKEIDNKNYWHFLSHPNEYHKHCQELEFDTMKRQFKTASEILNRLKKNSQKGILLADDVGLGKTFIAVLVASVYAGKGNTVRILTPNKTMQKKWKDEIDNHVRILPQVANNLKLKKENVHTTKLKQLKPGNILVTTHRKVTSESKATSESLKCDLLIIDEAHRAKGENSVFTEKLIEGNNLFKKVIFLTATPFSIEIKEFIRMLNMIGGSKDVKNNVENFDKKLKKLWNPIDFSDEASFSNELAMLAEKAIESLKYYVIRHGIEDLKNEKKNFGNVEIIDSNDEKANLNDYEILIRTDRLLKLCNEKNLWDKDRTNDPRYHVGWNQLRNDIEDIERRLGENTQKNYEVVKDLTKEISEILKKTSNHPKAIKVANEVKKIVDEEEKVLIFCHHHATAVEITCLIDSMLKRKRRKTNERIWKKAWNKIIIDEKPENAPKGFDFSQLRDNYIKWLCSPNIRSQIADWIGNVPDDSEELEKILKKKYARNSNPKKISDEANILFKKLINKDSKSTLYVLNNIEEDSLKFNKKNISNKVDRSRMPGMPHDSKKKMPVISTAEPDKYIDDDLKYLFFPNQIDTVMTVFNSPFGPDVLVATDRLSEGIDLHGCCRYLIHYELDPSPIRIIQRNGRIRRVNSWAAKTNSPIQISYPAFGGTRDEKLVKIMKDRIDRFDLLLGGVGEKIEIEANNELEQSRLDIIDETKNKLKKMSLALK